MAKKPVRKLGQIRIPFISPLITKFKVARAKHAVGRLESRIRQVCQGAERAKDLIEKAEQSATNIDSKRYFDAAENLRERFDDRVAKACGIAIEIERGEKAPTVPHVIVDPKKEKFIGDAKACDDTARRAVPGRWKRPPKEATIIWVECMKGRNHGNVAEYLSAEKRKQYRA